MPSELCYKIISTLDEFPNALFKFISANDVGITGSHQYGFYLPINAWQMFTPNPPDKGVNSKHYVSIIWQDELKTESHITWYGKKTRREYRLTQFGRNFPWLQSDKCGNLLVLIFKSKDEFLAYILEYDDDIEYLLNFFGIEIYKTWGIYNKGIVEEEFDEKSCITYNFSQFVCNKNHFPSTMEISKFTWDTMLKCHSDFIQQCYDKRIMTLLEEEYRLFRLLENKIHQPVLTKKYKSMEDFLNTANSILQSRKSRAGKSIENYFEMILKEMKIEHIMRSSDIDGKPDVLIPSVQAYNDINYPKDKIFVVGIKRTCKDRWRQVLNEATKISKKYIFTIQPSISKNQLEEMQKANVSLIVPESLHKSYPSSRKMHIFSLQNFLYNIKQNLS